MSQLEQELETRIQNLEKEVENWFSKYQSLKLQLKQINFEKGVLQSEIDELKTDLRKCQSNNKKLENMIPGHNLEFKEARILFKKEKLFQDQKNEISELKAAIKVLERDKATLIYKLNKPPF